MEDERSEKSPVIYPTTPAQHTQSNFLTKCSSCYAACAARVRGRKVDAAMQNYTQRKLPKPNGPSDSHRSQSWPLCRTPGIIDNITPFWISHIFETIWNEPLPRKHRNGLSNIVRHRLIRLACPRTAEPVPIAADAIRNQEPSSWTMWLASPIWPRLVF